MSGIMTVKDLRRELEGFRDQDRPVLLTKDGVDGYSSIRYIAVENWDENYNECYANPIEGQTQPAVVICAR